MPPNIGPEVLASARDMVRRGLYESSLEAYRTTYTVVWKQTMEVCFALTDDPRQLRELLERMSLSISTFIEDTATAISNRMHIEQAELTRGTHAERRATVASLLEGAGTPTPQAERRLGYRLTGPHVAAVVWTEAPVSSDLLAAAAEQLVGISGAQYHLTVMASAGSSWLWLPVESMPELDDVVAGLSQIPDVQVAIGRPGSGPEGFRSSHRDALDTQRVLTRLASRRRVARYRDVQLVALLTADPERANEFVEDVLGDLVHADPEVIEAVVTYLREHCSTTRTAARLFTHRNTVVRRIARADQLLPRPLADDIVAVGAALHVLSWSR